jgi:hypothetical protein
MGMRHRIIRLEGRHCPTAIYPRYVLFSSDREVVRICLSDGSSLTDQDAITALHQLPRSIPLKVYVGFDPDILLQPPKRVNHEPQEPA